MFFGLFRVLLFDVLIVFVTSSFSFIVCFGLLNVFYCVVIGWFWGAHLRLRCVYWIEWFVLVCGCCVGVWV